MNEQIEKLISEAIKAIPDHVDFDLPKEFTEKFAELIVGECSGIVQNYMSRWREDCDLVIKIKEHFGVEE
jgi:hypothetical protein